ncbi:translocase [Marivita hallyeonensis]|uniref:Translocase n=1 Tax=Marivita hallyeonensis TaxID=996342 RepID=A0A1M5TK43_9RHOB|nr:translocase [Marivita hallyeonensis]SHH51074.1 hypothetical protein SAMN05443551_2262 [Marivita hallyeonensis]
MDRKYSMLIAIGTVATALGIGAAMQLWPLGQTAANGDAPLPVSDVQEVSSTPKSSLPTDAAMNAFLPVSVVSNSVKPEDAPKIELPQSTEDAGFDCTVDMTAEPAAGAMIAVTLSAPCYGSERVTMHHNGMMFTELVQPDGTLSLNIPALAERALVIASFLDGAGAVAHAEVTSVPFYERVVLQWRGDAGLQLHAREFDAEYFSDGHIWQGSESDASRAATGEGGFLVSLGNADAPDALMAEVYTFPTGMTDTSGTVALTIEAEISDANCNAVVEAQTLEMRNGNGLRAKEVTIDVPSCDTVGDFLLLKNIVEDLTIALN